MSKKLNIMIVNDDGITSPGMRALADALSSRANIYISAPDGERSAMSQAITISDPIRVYDFDYPGAEAALTTTGTPTDCTKVGLQFFRERGIEMDMVYSGINIGSNFGKDTLYSGTIGAAMEAALSNVHAVAVSVDSHSATHFDAACDVALDVIDRSLKELTPDTILNINAPDIPREEVKGIRYTVLGNRFYIDKFVRANSFEEAFGDGEYGPQKEKLEEESAHDSLDPGDSYMMDGQPIDLEDVSEKFDSTATWDGYVSVTPLHFDFTAYDMMGKVSSWDIAGSTGLGEGHDGSGIDGQKSADAKSGRSKKGRAVQ